MRFVQPVAVVLGVAMYVVIIWFSPNLITYYNVGWVFVIAGVWNFLLLVATVITIVDAILRIRARKGRQLATDAMVVKLASIPFFMLNFFALTGLILGGLASVLFGGPLFTLAGFIGSGLAYLAMLSTSIYAWAAATQLKRDKIIGAGLTVLYTILLFVPVADVAASVLLFGHSRRRPRLALIVVLLSVGVILIAFGLYVLFGVALPASVADPALNGGVNPATALSIILLVAGGAVTVPTLVLSAVHRSSMRIEAQLAAVGAASSTESDARDPVLAP